MDTENNPGRKLRLEHAACNICGSTDYRVLIEPTVTEFDPAEVLTASKGVRGTQTIVRCGECGLTYVNPRIETSLVAESYRLAEDDVYTRGAAGRTHTFRQCVRKISRWKKPPGKLLDIGCAAGFFVAEARKFGWDAAGIEPSEYLVDWGREHLGENLVKGTLKQGDFKDGKFDILTMWDVLEHVTDPLGELTECFRICKPGGMLIINYPDFGSLLARIAGKRWWFLLSNHLYYFTPDTMKKILEKAGFEVLKFSMHWQTLPLGYLSEIAGMYSKTLSRAGGRILKTLKMENIPIPYYAAQTNVVAVKPFHGKH